jgi:hypothetical protein
MGIRLTVKTLETLLDSNARAMFISSPDEQVLFIA